MNLTSRYLPTKKEQENTESQQFQEQNAAWH